MKQNPIQAGHGVLKSLAVLCTAGVVLFSSACSKPSNEDGEVINQLALPTDVVLNLACADVGVHPETCVLADPANPFVTVTIEEFDVNNPNAPFNKFDLANAIPPGPTGAKARFYFWATALARRPSGENQFFTAQALHELFDANSNQQSADELVRTQALNAYRSVLDNFFGSAVRFTCCAGANNGQPIEFPVSLRVLAADSIHRTARTNLRRLIDGDPLLAIQQLSQWGYRYQPGTAANNFDDGVVEAIVGP